jgi:hypothetical protein
MEPIQLFIGFLLITGGISLMNSDDSESIEENGPMMVVESSVVSDKPVYKRGIYYRTSQGYYVSNLTPKPKAIDGCERSVLTADLSSPRSDGDSIQVTEHRVECEG